MMKPVIVGAGLAGLSVALGLAPQPVILLSPKKLGEDCASAWAQGGIAGAVAPDDSAALHAEDTIKAGGGICDASVAQRVTQDGADIIARLTGRGVDFDRDAENNLLLAMEGAHGKRRVAHVADSTGNAIMQALVDVARVTPSIEIIEDTVATDLRVEDNAIVGIEIERNGEHGVLATNQVVLATGGAGALWQHTTNPLTSKGSGLALAARAGAVLGDLEFMQFHPTALDIGSDPMPLASEALRGEGCVLIDEKGERFVDELLSRDVVSRAIAQHMEQGHRVYLDGRSALGDDFALRFPAIYAQCMEAGIDPAWEPFRVRPAAHYHMGGVVTDINGRTSISGLWACGEVASTGLHGANRLASNSLLEAASFGQRVAEDIMNAPVSENQRVLKPIDIVRNRDVNAPYIRAVMSEHVGMLRDRDGLITAVQELAPLAETSDMALAGFMIAAFALLREESRGAHMRSDYPASTPLWAHRQMMTLADVMHLMEPYTHQPLKRVAGA